MPVDYVARLAQAQATLEERQRERRGTGPVSGRTERRDRQRLLALAQHPGVQPAADEESGPKGMQGITTPEAPTDLWSQWQVAPSYGGRSGRRMSDTARYNAEAGLMEVGRRRYPDQR